MIQLIRRLTDNVMLVLVAGYPTSVVGGISFVNLDQALAIFQMLLKPGWLSKTAGCRSEAETVFAGTNVKLTSEGRPYLGSAIGSSSYVKQFVEEKVKGWSSDVTLLAKVAQSQPHGAYSAFAKGLASRWIYVSRTIPDIATLLQPLEDVIHCVLVSVLTGRAPPNDFERDLFALPPRWGGLGLCNPICRVSQEFSASLKITEPLCKLILHHDLLYPEAKADQLSQKSSVQSLKQDYYSRCSSDIRQHLSSSL